MKVHHIGYAVPDIDKAIAEFESLGWVVCSEITDDHARQVRIVFIKNAGLVIELVSPLSESSPICKTLQKGSGTPYHVCYEVENIEAAEAELKKARFLPFKKAAVALAIGGRRVSFMFAKNVGIVELVETDNLVEYACLRKGEKMVAEKDFLTFVAGILDVSAESISLETAYESIPEWDSVMQLRLTLEIGSEYGVEIPVDEIANIKTLGQFYAYIKG